MQGVIIALCLLLVLLIVGLILLNNKRVAAEASATDANARAQEANSAASSAQGEANNYKTWMGFNEADTKETVQKSFEEDMKKYGSTADENVRFYSPLLKSMQAEIETRGLSELKAKEDATRLNEQLVGLKAEMDKQFAEFDKQFKQLQQDSFAERNKFNQQREEANAEKDRLSKQLAEQRGQIDKLAADRAAAEKKLDDEVAGLGRDIEILRNNQADPDPFAQPADGLIRWVNQKEQRLWINIGEADHLRTQVTFSVYSGDESDALKADTKGSIEVTKILGPHMAEARITSDVPTRPLMEGDKVYSQVWNRGRQVGFAIAGFIDMEGDGKPDIDELKSVIQLNNGKVDAIPGDTGLVDGEMTVDTRYLILGKYPESTVSGGDVQRQAWEKMTETADRLGIETITLDEFLTLMGWKADRRTVTLGVSARPDDFPPKPAGDYHPPKNLSGTGGFHPRKPQPTY